MDPSERESSAVGGTGVIFAASDVLAAAALLTRIPLPVDHARAGRRAAASAWAFPLIGAALGAAAGAAYAGLSALGVPGGMAAAAALALLAMATGAMHEDGLADMADGVGGGWSVERRLEIMKDSRIGAYGATALSLALLARWSGVEALAPGQAIAALAAAGAVSRATMGAGMRWLRPARADGMSAGVGRPGAAQVWLGLGLAGLICAALFGLAGGAVFATGLIGAAAVFALACRALGGQTGDVLGAAQQIAEIAVLGAAAAIAM